MNLLATFGKLTPEERDMLVALGRTQAYKSGETIVHQGEIVSSLMVISTGFVRVTRAYLDELVAEFAGPLGPGEVIGEMSLMDGIGASANIIADGPTELLMIAKADLMAKLEADDGFAARMYDCLFLDLCRKLRSTNQRVLPVPP